MIKKISILIPSFILIFAVLYGSEDNKAPKYEKYIKKASNNSDFVGSKKCSECHSDIYDEWKLSQHARMSRTPEEVAKLDGVPLEELGVSKEQLVIALGSHYVHRFVAEQNGELIVVPKIWDIREKCWIKDESYIGEDVLWQKECAGCHTTGFSSENECFIEPGIGCEACHGAGSKHVKSKNPKDIVSHKSVSEERMEMVCISCHTSGMDNSYTYSFPVGYKPGEDISKFYSGLTPKPGQTKENFVGDESYADRLRQWNFLKPRLLLASGLTCDYCKNFRKIKTTDNSEFMTYNQYCQTCHADKSDHPKEAPGTNCVICHKPNKHLNGKLSIHDHKFRFE